MKHGGLLLALAAAVATAVAVGFYLAARSEARVTPASALPAAVRTTTTLPVTVAEVEPLAPAVVTVASIQKAWASATTFEAADHAAAALAELNTAESVQVLMEGIKHTPEWSERAALAKNLRAVSDPETLVVLVPALLDNYGRGSTILGEIVDAIARLAQPETVEDLAALHWQASTQAGQGHKVLRAVASIRNPAATRGLARLVARSDSPALSAAAQEALKALQEKTAGQATQQ